MKSNFEERRAARLDAFQRLAASNENLSVNAWKRSSDLANMIPMGQPILVGHHSEKRHRRHLEKMDNSMRQSVEASKKAAYYKDRAESLLNGTAISSDDPNAIDKLTEKLKKLEDLQELYKSINKILRKKISDVEKVGLLQALGLSEKTAVGLVTPDQWKRVGIPSYRMTNNNAVINNTKKRIEHLSKIATIETSEEEINGVTLRISAEDNRVQIFFPGKPSEEIRAKLKGAGFHWAPSVGAWMRQISNSAIYYAKNILKSI